MVETIRFSAAAGAWGSLQVDNHFTRKAGHAKGTLDPSGRVIII
jgi:hypothetical protein